MGQNAPMLGHTTACQPAPMLAYRAIGLRLRLGPRALGNALGTSIVGTMESTWPAIDADPVQTPDANTRIYSQPYERPELDAENIRAMAAMFAESDVAASSKDDFVAAGIGFGFGRKGGAAGPPVADGNFAGVQTLTPRQVFELRQAGDPIVIGGRSLPSTDVIAAAAGYAPGDVARLTPAQVAANLDAVQPLVEATNARYGNLPHDLINAVIAYESGGMPNAVSATGALGIMQITSQNYLSGGYNPFIPEHAINAGGEMLSKYIDRYGSNLEGINKTIAAYNQGQGAVDSAVRQGGSDWTKYLPTEGQRYITNIQLIRGGAYKPIPGYFGR